MLWSIGRGDAFMYKARLHTEQTYCVMVVQGLTDQHEFGLIVSVLL